MLEALEEAKVGMISTAGDANAAFARSRSWPWTESSITVDTAHQ